jgi:hypothetical protein
MTDSRNVALALAAAVVATKKAAAVVTAAAAEEAAAAVVTAEAVATEAAEAADIIEIINLNIYRQHKSPVCNGGFFILTKHFRATSNKYYSK